MPKQITIGLWNFDAAISNQTLDARVQGLDKAAGLLQDAVVDKLGAGSFDSILVAPEYAFSLRDERDRKPMSERDRMMVEHKIIEVSGKYKRMVMFPGTLFYCKDLIRPT